MRYVLCVNIAIRDLLLYLVTVSLILMTLFPVFVDAYHKEHLVTKEEAEAVAAIVQWELDFECEWAEVAVTKDGDTAARIADILDKYGINKVAGHIRGMGVLSSVYTNTIQDPFVRTQ